jgi:aryl-alcohol dehydrogenase-like predicted oxidoreductase
MDRRRFLQHGSLAAMAGIGAAPRSLAGAVRKHATDRIRLGPAAIELSRLAVGTGTNGVAGSSNQTRGLGLQGVAELLRAAYDQGVTFWDSADQYGTHPHLSLALKGIPREKLTILSKTHASSEKEMRADLDRFRRELGTDYIDILLLHGMRSDNWPAQKRGAMAVISEAREKGTVRTCGVSCHSLGALNTAAASSWVEVVLARINPAGTAMDAGPETVLGVLRRMKGAGKGIIGMKILGAGRLRGRIDECLGFALSQDCVDCFTIGSENRAEFEQLLRKIPEASVRA